MTLAPAQADRMLDAVNSAVMIQLHLGDPGIDGTLEPATDTSRKPVTMRSAEYSTCVNASAMRWDRYPAQEHPTHFSAWTPEGDFLYSGTITVPPLGIGDSCQIPVGGLSTRIVAVNY